MLRALSILACLASTLLFLATATLAVRGYRVTDYFWTTQGGRNGLTSSRGHFVLWHDHSPARVSEPFAPSHRIATPAVTLGPNNQPNADITFDRAGFAFWRSDGRPSHHTYFRFPAWPVLLVTAPWPALFARRTLRRRRERRRAAHNLCATCGYDLRASPDRCPECGTPVTVSLHHAIAPP